VPTDLVPPSHFRALSVLSSPFPLNDRCIGVPDPRNRDPWETRVNRAPSILGLQFRTPGGCPLSWILHTVIVVYCLEKFLGLGGAVFRAVVSRVRIPGESLVWTWARFGPRAVSRGVYPRGSGGRDRREGTHPQPPLRVDRDGRRDGDLSGGEGGGRAWNPFRRSVEFHFNVKKHPPIA